MNRLLAIVPLLLLAAAALACDDPLYDPPRVHQVWADAADGPIYAQVGTFEDQAVYLTTDAGESWQPAPPDVPVPPTAPILDLAIRGETIYQGQMPIWSFPRPMFRYFFLDDGERQYFALPYIVSGVMRADTVYIAMGTEGVLVGPRPGSGSTQPWRLTSTGLAALDPLPLTITEPGTITTIVLLGLLVPPLTLLHVYGLTRPLRYFLDPKRAWTAAWTLTLILTALAAVAIVVWLTDVRTDYYGVVAVMTAIVVLSGIGLTAWQARAAGIPVRTRRRLTIAAGFASALVPGGVAAIWMLWWAVLGVLIGFLLLRLPFVRAFRRAGLALDDRRHRWLVDWLGVSTVMIAAVIGAVIIGLVGAVRLPPMLAHLRGLFEIPVVIGGLVVCAWGVYRVSRWRMARLATVDLSGAALTITRWEIVSAVVLALIASGGSAFLTFAFQAQAYGYFTTLLTP